MAAAGEKTTPYVGVKHTPEIKIGRMGSFHAVCSCGWQSKDFAPPMAQARKAMKAAFADHINEAIA